MKHLGGSLDRTSALKGAAFILLLALGVLGGSLAAGAQDDPAEFNQLGEPMAPEEIVYWESNAPCPDELGDATNVGISPLDIQQNTGIAIRCFYTDADNGAWEINLKWANPGSASGTLCDRTVSETEFRNTYGSPDLDYEASISLPGDPEVRRAQGEVVRAFGEARAAECARPLSSCAAIDGFMVASQGGKPQSFTSSSDGLVRFSCSYESVDEDSVTQQQTFTVVFAGSGAVQDDLQRICSVGEYFFRGEGRIGSDGITAIDTTYVIDSPVAVSTDPLLAAAAVTAGELAERAASCDGVDLLAATPFTPIPSFLDGAFGDDVVGEVPPLLADLETAAVAPPPTPVPAESSTPAPTPIPAPTSEDAAVSPAEAAPAVDAGGGENAAGGFETTVARSTSTLAKALTYGSIGLSVLGLLLTFWLIRRESRIRPKLDVFRILLMGGVAVVTVVFLAREVPVVALAVGIGVGLVLGLWQGRNLIVRFADGRFRARRNRYAIAAFVAGLVVTQVGGLLDRTGAVTIGVAMTAFSVAMSLGLVVGRVPRMGDARRTAGIALLVLIGVLLAPLGLESDALAQDDSGQPEAPAFGKVIVTPLDRTPEHDALIDLIPWDTVEFQGGIYAGSEKPYVQISVPRALDSVPDAFARAVAWESDLVVPRAFDLQESFVFNLRTDGFCCSIDYEVVGTVVTSPGSDTEESFDVEGSGTLADIQALTVEGRGFSRRIIDDHIAGSPIADIDQSLFFSQPESGCGLPVAETRSDFSLDETAGGAAIDWVEAPPELDNAVTRLVVPCDIAGFSIADALAAAPLTPALDDVQRQTESGPFGDFAVPEFVRCPVLQELVGALSGPDQLPGAHVRTISDLYLNPNRLVCSAAGLEFGQGGPDGIRHQLDVDFGQPRLGEWDNGTDQWGVDVLDDKPADVVSPDTGGRCVTGGNGVAEAPEDFPETSCQMTSLHFVGPPDEPTGQIGIFVDYTERDGPNTFVRATMPWGSYDYNCHHCLPDSPEIASFLESLNRFGSGFEGVNAPEIEAGEPADEAPDAEPADEAPDDQDEATDPADAGEDTAPAAELAEPPAPVSDERDGSESDDNSANRDTLIAAVATMLGAGAVGATLLGEGIDEPSGGLVSAWDPNADNGEGGWVQVSATERDRLEGIERDRERGRRRVRDDVERDADRAEREQHESTMAAIDTDYANEMRRAELEKLQRANETDQAYWVNPINWLSEAGSDFNEGVWDDFYAMSRTDDQNALYQAATFTGRSIRATLDAVADAASQPGAARIVGETIVGTLYDATIGLVTGDDVTYDHLSSASDLADNLIEFVGEHKLDIAMSLVGLDQLAAAADPNLPLHERLAAYGAFATEILTDVLTGGALLADDAIDAARVIDRLDDIGDGARGGRRVGGLADEAVPPKSLTTKYLESGSRTEHDLHWVDADRIDSVGDLVDGTILPQSRIASDFGIRPEAYRQLRGVTERNGIGIQVRSTSGRVPELLARGDVPKPQPVKIKTASQLDVYLGVDPDDLSRVPYRPDGWPEPNLEAPPNVYRPSDPDRLSRWKNVDHGRTHARWNQRQQELVDNQDAIAKLLDDPNTTRFDSERGLLLWRNNDTGTFNPITGDHDLWKFEVEIPEGMPTDQIDAYVARIKAEVEAELALPPFNAQHGAHTDWVPVSARDRGIDARIRGSHGVGGGDPLFTVRAGVPAHVRYSQGGS